jgi:hypothetical protein
MTLPAWRSRRKYRAMAARQALRLCEAELQQARGRAGTPPSSTSTGHRQSRIHPVAIREAPRAAGVPPNVAAALRRRLRLTPEQEAE